MVRRCCAAAGVDNNANMLMTTANRIAILRSITDNFPGFNLSILMMHSHPFHFDIGCKANRALDFTNHLLRSAPA
jgi:hypothetical protein